jgi:hypothetical protein
MRTLAMPKTAEPWSLTSLREKLIKIGAKVVNQGRYVTFQMAEVGVPRGDPVVDRPAPRTAGPGMTGRPGQMRGTTTAEVRLDEGNAASSSAAMRAIIAFSVSPFRFPYRFASGGTANLINHQDHHRQFLYRRPEGPVIWEMSA